MVGRLGGWESGWEVGRLGQLLGGWDSGWEIGRLGQWLGDKEAGTVVEVWEAGTVVG